MRVGGVGAIMADDPDLRTIVANALGVTRNDPDVDDVVDALKEHVRPPITGFPFMVGVKNRNGQYDAVTEIRTPPVPDAIETEMRQAVAVAVAEEFDEDDLGDAEIFDGVIGISVNFDDDGGVGGDDVPDTSDRFGEIDDATDIDID